MYLTPQPYKCDRCAHEFQWSPHDHHPAPVIDDEPLCPVCYANFLRAHVGIGKCTVDWGANARAPKPEGDAP